ncbi:MAG: helix-turn-helix domain-containing protein [Oscillospiraceae bacterium]|nr:helix-turn-helix domain-containing protein [Oscillospiraceae bacterium]
MATIKIGSIIPGGKQTMNDMAYVVGERVRNYRLRAGLTQMKLAEKAGVHHTYIGQLERGEKNATLETIEKIARALNISFETLFEAMLSGDTENSIAREIYELVTAQPEKDQKVLLDLIKRTVHYRHL